MRPTHPLNKQRDRSTSWVHTYCKSCLVVNVNFIKCHRLQPLKGCHKKPPNIIWVILSLLKYFSFSVPSVLLDYRIFVLIAREVLSIAFSMLRTSFKRRHALSQTYLRGQGCGLLTSNLSLVSKSCCRSL